MLGLGLVAALVLVSGPAGREPLTHDEYVAAVRAATDGKTSRLIEDVVNTNFYRCRVCVPDTRTAVGSAWVRSVRSLRAELEAVADRLERVHPPANVARLHPAWISAIRGCAERLYSLEDLELTRPADEVSKVSRIGKLDGIGVFQETVAREFDRGCFDHFDEFLSVFHEKGYFFNG